MKRQQVSYNTLLRLIGVIAKFLFVGMFICTVVCLLTAAFGAPDVALSLYSSVWNLFWRTGLTLLCVLSVIITWEALQ
ncbi:MAG: hypothetical protein F6J95_015900 [Leptolyngbya sp. SIO1E4]|nr:hypothetical protein [Leptolyngbya sp. SIO1E4]